jgi:hypothetical protein
MTDNIAEIVVTFSPPPIPWRGGDYCAVRDGYEEGDCMGYGETEEEAIIELMHSEDLSDIRER